LTTESKQVDTPAICRHDRLAAEEYPKTTGTPDLGISYPGFYTSASITIATALKAAYQGPMPTFWAMMRITRCF